MTNKIEKQIDIEAPVSRVWQALTDHREFGEWFGVNIEGSFAEGESATGRLTTPGFDHLSFEMVIKTIKPESRFAYTWHPHAVDPDKDYSGEKPTLVEFCLEAIASGTQLTITETGFDDLPADRREEAFRMNEGGWGVQSERIAKYVTRDS